MKRCISGRWMTGVAATLAVVTIHGTFAAAQQSAQDDYTTVIVVLPEESQSRQPAPVLGDLSLVSQWSRWAEQGISAASIQDAASVAQEPARVAERNEAPAAASHAPSQDGFDQVARVVEQEPTPATAIPAEHLEPTYLAQAPRSLSGDACCTSPVSDCCSASACCGPSPCCRPHCVAGAEATFFVPDVRSGTYRFTFLDNNLAPPGTQTITSGRDAIDGIEFSPRIWIGIEDGCWGVVARFWHLEAVSSDFNTFEGLDDGGFELFNQLEMTTIDLELTRRFQHCDTTHLLTGGARYAYAEAAGDLDTVHETADGIFFTSAKYRNLAEGIGLTGSLHGWRPIYCGSCVHCFWGVRGSLLWGHNETLVETSAFTDGVAASINGAATRLDDPMLIGEAQLGVQWNHRLRRVPVDAFLRIAFEYQYWNNDDGTAEADSFAGVGAAPPSTLVTTEAETNGLNVSLYGFSIGSGFTW